MVLHQTRLDFKYFLAIYPTRNEEPCTSFCLPIWVHTPHHSETKWSKSQD